jgi:uncharacterized protein YktA (UPF0223 family)
MKINVTTTIEIEKDVEDQLTQEDLDEAYEQFKELVAEAHKTGDITNFLFINADTNMQIEDEVDYNV